MVRDDGNGRTDGMIAIELVEETPATVQAKALLEEQLRQHDLRAYLFTRQIRIAPVGIPHSHPVLTLTPRLVGQPDRFLSVFVHEQMHWFLCGVEAETEAAVAALGERYPEPPEGPGPVAHSGQSTWLHLAVTWLELQALKALLGHKRARAVLAEADVHRWIREAVLRDEDEIGAVLAAHGLTPPSAGRRDRYLDE